MVEPEIDEGMEALASRYYTLEGDTVKPIEGHDMPAFIKWAQWFETADRIIDKSMIKGVAVSTVFLGVDHNFNGGAPILFETMIFGGVLDGYQSRCRTKIAALEMHAYAVTKVKRSQMWDAVLLHKIKTFFQWLRKPNFNAYNVRAAANLLTVNVKRARTSVKKILAWARLRILKR
jgi:hypothetical protein